MTIAKVDAGHAGGLVTIEPGQSASNAALADGISFAGAMSAGYGGSGENLTYAAEANFVVAAAEEFYLTLLDNNHIGGGIYELTFEIEVNGAPYFSIDTHSLIFAEKFFDHNTFDLGPGTQTVDLSYTLSSYRIGDGFGSTYTGAIPEASTWAMLMTGFTALGLTTLRRVRADKVRVG